MDIPAYLDRIAYRGSILPTPGTLQGLQRAHMLAVPFENLDIHLGREIVLDEARFFAKIVGERRGGFCYEMNGLFAAVLRDLGFRVTMLSAGVAHASGGFGPEFDHMALLVELEERWLADVGFGDSFLEPLPLDRPGEGPYRVASDGEYRVVFRDDAPQYRFTLRPHRLGDYAERCRYHQTSPQSSFTQGRLITLATPDGRVTLTDRRLVVTRRGERQEHEVAGEEEFTSLARTHFGFFTLKQ